MLSPKDIFYKVRNSINNYSSFPSPIIEREAPETHTSIVFKDSKERFLIKTTSESIEVNEYTYPGSLESGSENLGHPEQCDAALYIDQTLDEIASNGIDKSKVKVLNYTKVESKLTALLNGLDCAFMYALGGKSVNNRFRIAT